MVELLLLSSYDMDWSLLFCFVWINFISIQALSKNNNEQFMNLMKFLHRKKIQNTYNSGVNPSTVDRSNQVNLNHPIKRNAIVRMDIINGKERPKQTKKEPAYHGNGKYSMALRKGIDPNNPNIERYMVVDMKIINGRAPKQPKKEPVYHGNGKWGVLRNSNKYKSLKKIRINHDESSDEDAKLKSILRALVSYQELPNTIDDSGNQKLNPGNSLLQLKDNDLASASKFPVNEKSTLVYGNLDNLGIKYGKTNQRVEYSGFRKSNYGTDLFNTFNTNQLPKSNSGSKKWIVIEITPNKLRPNPFLGTMRPMHEEEEEENTANEIIDEYGNNYSDDDIDYRRKKKGNEYRKREELNEWKSGNESSSSSRSTSEESSGGAGSSERNPGNPFTLHKGKYIQNWLWNHNMDGDHMNINPYGPQFHDMGATGQDLYFGRKWWYFNQDDYKPMG